MTATVAIVERLRSFQIARSRSASYSKTSNAKFAAATGSSVAASIRKIISSPWAIVGFSLAVRLIFLINLIYAQPVPTHHRYLIGYETGSIAASIAQGHGYSSPLYDPSGPTAWITPVYPYLLAGVFKIFGVYTLSASVAIRSLNILFSSLTCLPIIALGRRLFGETTGTVAGWLWAVLPYSVFFSVVWVWDTSLSALMLSLALLATYAIEERTNPWSWSGFGALWGFAALVNAAILSILPGCLLFAAYQARRRGGAWLRLSGLAAIAFAVTVAPWVIRNEAVFHGQVFFRSNFGLELWLGNNPDVPDSSTWWLHPSDNAQEHEKYMRMGEIPYMQEKQRLAVQFMKSHPADAARFMYHRMMDTWTGNKDAFSDIWATGNFLLRANLILNYSLPLFMLLGLLWARRKSHLLTLPLLNVLALFPAVYYVCHTTPRYRHPIDPVVCVLVAYAVVNCVLAVRSRFFAPGKAETESATSTLSY